MGIKIKVRQATRKDRFGISDVNKKCLPVGYDIDYWESKIGEKHSYVICASGLIVGYILGSFEDINGVIISFGILEEYRGKGYGKQLLELCCNDLLKTTSAVVLRVKDDNITAQHAYHQVGFKKIEFLKNYYSFGGSAYLMKTTRETLGKPTPQNERELDTYDELT